MSSDSLKCKIRNLGEKHNPAKSEKRHFAVNEEVEDSAKNVLKFQIKPSEVF